MIMILNNINTAFYIKRPQKKKKKSYGFDTEIALGAALVNHL